ncbi:hypothetical protein [Cardiobacterium hominis]|uniref:hypothetical protein n=1 Tax=Cardiobacterium hominis TaxID=2718 RepID=UPI0028D1854C|nr:hypothetical protein [Cardiobacterium hominis]
MIPFLRTLCLAATTASLPAFTAADTPAVAAQLQQIKSCQATRYDLKTMLYHEDFNIPMCTGFGDPFMRDAFPKTIDKPPQRAPLDALVQSLDIAFTDTDIKAHGGFDHYSGMPHDRSDGHMTESEITLHCADGQRYQLYFYDRTFYFKDHPAVEMAAITLDDERTFYTPAASIDRLVDALKRLVSREEAHAWYKKIGVIGPDDLRQAQEKMR